MLKRSKFSDQQIAFILRQAEEGVAVDEVSQGGDIAADLLPLAQEVRRIDAFGDEAHEAAGRGEPASEASRGGFEPGPGNAAGRLCEKALKPAQRRTLVNWMRTA